MSCTPPPTPEASTFTVSLDGQTVNVTPKSHGTQKLEKVFHLVITDGSAVFTKDPIEFEGAPPAGVFRVCRQSPCYVRIEDTPIPSKKCEYGFSVCVSAPGGGEEFRSADPTIVNDPEPPQTPS